VVLANGVNKLRRCGGGLASIGKRGQVDDFGIERAPGGRLWGGGGPQRAKKSESKFQQQKVPAFGRLHGRGGKARRVGAPAGSCSGNEKLGRQAKVCFGRMARMPFQCQDKGKGGEAYGSGGFRVGGSPGGEVRKIQREPLHKGQLTT